MTDLTYLFPQEPIEPDDIIVLDHLPHWLLNRELNRVFRELGFIWHGSASVNEDWPAKDGVAAVLHVGTMKSSAEDFPGFESVYRRLDYNLRHIRYRNPKYRLLLASTTSSGNNNNVWFRFEFRIPPLSRVILAMHTDH